MIELIEQNWKFFLIGQYPYGPLGGIAGTIWLSILSVCFCFPVGLLLALSQTSSIGWLKQVSSTVSSLIRSIPLVMLIFWVYFLLPKLTGYAITGFTTMLVTLTLFQGAYMGEILKAGIMSLPRGQIEAARSIGLSYSQAQTDVILPQVLYNMAPSIISQLVATIKDTSLGYIIGVQELMYAGSQVNSSVMVKPLQVFAITSAGYFIICFSLSSFTRYLEHRITNRRNPNKIASVS
ncbi:amino acid ABC transporter permease [Agrobacterium vitis]|uniref:amino acid ABC transporter permease n=1 Tax=Rhizobium/Agrobacterium group TaxID=227290 RepID=UPI001F2E2A20|nr:MULTISPECIES: amino acid ABC transporter permease [Rhizobium/Agrobacterium group]MCF1485151.1 amino acid ABC transporter permease [Allorhizobium ampelinum]MCM2450233.1 amino acid ABC transporter permease [Agrobacterium vitis]MCM2471264.1 amino acid ABC transporter permease [Agrobacterium vitis]